MLGVTEEEWSNTPEAIADWLKWYDSLEPLVMTPEEQAEWEELVAASFEATIQRTQALPLVKS